MPLFLFIEPKWQLSYEDSEIIILDLEKPSVYYTFDEVPSKEIVDALHAKIDEQCLESNNQDQDKTDTNYAVQVKENRNENNITIELIEIDGRFHLSIQRKLKLSLELKPIKLMLTRNVNAKRYLDVQRSLSNSWMVMASENKSLVSTNKEQRQIINDMVEEKQKYQDLMLRKVAAILEERRVQLNAIKSQIPNPDDSK